MDRSKIEQGVRLILEGIGEDVERETVDKEELAALLDNKWDEFLKKEAEAKPADASSGSDSGEPAASEPVETPYPSVPLTEPPMAPGTPPVLGS